MNIRNLTLIIFASFSFSSMSVLLAMKTRDKNMPYVFAETDKLSKRLQQLTELSTKIKTKDVEDREIDTLDDDGKPVKRKLSDVVNDSIFAISARIAKESGSLDINDIAIRGFAGDKWEALAEANPKNFKEAMKQVLAFKTASVFGKHIDITIENSLGDILDGAFGGIFGGISSAVSTSFRTIRNFATGRSGIPFNVRELTLMRDSVKLTFEKLERAFKSSPLMEARSRDKVGRTEDTPTDALDVLWIGQRQNLMNQLNFWINQLSKRRVYYNPSSDESIVFYAEQIEDILKDIKQNFVLPAKSQKEFASTANQQGLQIRREIIDINFNNLIKYVAPRSSEEKGSKDSSSSSQLMRQRLMRDDDRSDNPFFN